MESVTGFFTGTLVICVVYCLQNCIANELEVVKHKMFVWFILPVLLATPNHVLLEPGSDKPGQAYLDSFYGGVPGGLHQM